MEKLLYESKGSLYQQKRLKRLKGLSTILIILALFLWIFSFLFVRTFLGVAKIVLFLAIVVVIAASFSIKKNNKIWDMPQLRIYENHIEGVQINPFLEFTLTYEEIHDVQKAEVLFEALVIKTARQTFTVHVNNMEYAYSIIDKKLEQLEKI